MLLKSYTLHTIRIIMRPVTPVEMRIAMCEARIPSGRDAPLQAQPLQGG